MRNNKKKILMTGGGTAGHVIPNIALIDEFKNNDYEIVYVGSKTGIERRLIEKERKIKYYPISTGKLRRYFSWQNFTDIFKVIAGIISSTIIIKKESPDLIFSKGGFVSVPVLIGGFLNKKNILAHESDLSIGIATKISSKFAKKILTSFEETSKLFPNDKGVYTGTPIRKNLNKGDREIALQLCSFKDDKPFILLMGGSQGSEKLNSVLKESLNELSKSFNIIHQCGKGKVDSTINISNYKAFEFIGEELKDILALSDMIISRAGSNTIFEILKLKKPNLLIPLSKNASRGDQIDNAKVFEKKGFSNVLFEEELTAESFIKNIVETYEDRSKMIKKMEETSNSIGNEKIIKIIESYIN